MKCWIVETLCANCLKVGGTVLGPSAATLENVMSDDYKRANLLFHCWLPAVSFDTSWMQIARWNNKKSDLDLDLRSRVCADLLSSSPKVPMFAYVTSLSKHCPNSIHIKHLLFRTAVSFDSSWMQIALWNNKKPYLDLDLRSRVCPDLLSISPKLPLGLHMLRACPNMVQTPNTLNIFYFVHKVAMTFFNPLQLKYKRTLRDRLNEIVHTSKQVMICVSTKLWMYYLMFNIPMILHANSLNLK